MTLPWQRCFRNVIVPLLPLSGLRDLARELRAGGGALCRGSCYELAGMREPVVRRCCPALFPFWDSGGYRVGRRMLDEQWEWLIDQAAEGYSALNPFCESWDSGEISCEQLLSEVVRAIEGETTGV